MKSIFFRGSIKVFLLWCLGLLMVSAYSADNPQQLLGKPPQGEMIYRANCMACHQPSEPTAVGPPMMAVKVHVLQSYPKREDFVTRVAKWVVAPSADTGLMPGAIRKYGLMPVQKNLTQKELAIVAGWIYDTPFDTPDWFSAHYQAEHGVKPMHGSPSQH